MWLLLKNSNKHMKALIGLELRKQSTTFLGLLFIIVMCLTLVTASVSAFAGLTLSEAFSGINLMLGIFGIPFCALILGGGAGAALRSAQRKAEEEIPVRPSKRMLAGYIASLIYFILVLTILFAASTLIRDPSTREDFLVPQLMLILLPFHSAAFVFSYWLSQALLGGVVSTIINVPAFAFFPYWFYGFHYSNFFSLIAGPGVIAVCIQLSLMFWLANRIEREKQISLPTKIAIALAVAFAFFVSIIAVCWLMVYNSDI